MKRKIRWIVLFSAMTLLCFCRPNEKKSNGVSKGEDNSIKNELPSVPITFMDGSSRNIRDLNGKIVLILFQPDCDHCQREAAQIQQHLDAFEDYTLYFISARSLPEIEQFAVEYELKQPKVYFVQTTVDAVLSTFGSIPTPSVYIYSEDNTLVKKFNGETNIEDILQVL